MRKYSYLLLLLPLLLGLGKGIGNSLPTPVAQWWMNENNSGTTIYDSSGNGYHGTLMGGKTTAQAHVTGKIGGALTFNGSSDYVDTLDTFQSVFQDSFSINWWGKLIKIETIQDLIIFRRGLTFISGIYIKEKADSSMLEAHYYADSEMHVNPVDTCNFYTTYGTNWVMITFVVEQLDVERMRGQLYVNGLLKGESTENGLMSYFESANNVLIGKEDGGYYANGSIDNVAVYDFALSASQISDLYNMGLGREQ